MTIKKIKVSNLNDIVHQFEIETPSGTYFQSYESIVAYRPKMGAITLDRGTWDYSRTTGKYRNIFLGESKAETEAKIKSGTYKMADLN